jgi:hypothetical protein
MEDERNCPGQVTERICSALSGACPAADREHPAVPAVAASRAALRMN